MARVFLLTNHNLVNPKRKQLKMALCNCFFFFFLIFCIATFQAKKRNEDHFKSLPHFLAVLEAVDACVVFQSYTVYTPLLFYSIAAWKMSPPSWEGEYLDHTSGAGKKRKRFYNDKPSCHLSPLYLSRKGYSSNLCAK